MLKYGIVGILSAILAKYQYFSMKLRLFDKYHQITYSLQFSVQYNGKCGLHAKKHQKSTSRFGFK